MGSPPQGSNLFLQEAERSDKPRKAVEASPLAQKARVKASPNLAIYEDNGELHEVVAHVLHLAKSARQAYLNQRASLEERWRKADEFYWMAQKDYRFSELTRAKVSASVFHRVCRRLADGAFLATFSDEMPMKFFPEIDVFDPSETKRTKAVVADALNNFALYSMRRTNFKAKCRPVYHKLYKYADVIAYVPWDFAVEKRKSWKVSDPNTVVDAKNGAKVFEHSDTGEVSPNPWPHEAVAEEHDHILHDEVGFYPVPIENCYLDNRIEDLDRQTAFLWRSDLTRPEIFAQGMAGTWDNIDKVTDAHKWQLFGYDSAHANQRIADAGKTTSDSVQTEVYERWQCWMLLPRIKVKTGKKGKVTDLEWDQNAPSRRYLLELVGQVDGANVVVRFSESPYWGDGIPFVAAHSHEDDSGFYKRGLVELLEDNMLQEATAKGQLMDNRTLQNFRPMTRLVGRCKDKDMRITHNKVFDVTAQGAISQLDIRDISQTISGTLEYLRDDSEKIAQTPSFFMGDNLGARTSATEFASIRDQSSAPALNDIKSLNEQLIGGYMKKVKEYAPQFLDKDVAVKVMGPNGQEAWQMVTADEFDSELTLKEVSVQEFENKATMRQILLNLVGVISNPVFAPFINVGGFLERVFQTFSSVFPNPEEVLNKNPQVMDLLRQYLMQKPMQAETPNPGMPPPQMGPMGGPQGGPPSAMPPRLLPSAGQAEAEPQSAMMGAAGGA